MQHKTLAQASLLIILVFTTFAGVQFGDRRAAMPDTADRAEHLNRAHSHASLDELSAEADLVVRARVTAADSRWSDDARAIETNVELTPLYVLRGQTPPLLRFTVEGGYLPDEEIAMSGSHSVEFFEGEHVLLFLHRHGDKVDLHHGASSKYVIEGTNVLHPISARVEPLSELYAELVTYARTAEPGDLHPPADWERLEAEAAPAAVIRPSSFIYNNLKWPGENPVVDFYVNLNSTQIGSEDGSADDFFRAIINAANTWNNVETAAFTFRHAGYTDDVDPGFNGTNAVSFSQNLEPDVLGVSRYWYNTRTGFILEADVTFNDRTDLDATGSPDPRESDLQSIALHELGHWLSLGHDSDSNAVMYASLLTGTTEHVLHANDRAGISFIYPCAAEPCLPDSPDAPTATPTPEATVAPEATVTPTATPEGGSPPVEAATILPDQETEVTLDTGDGLSIQLVVLPDSVDEPVAIRLDSPTRVPDLNDYVYTGYGFQLLAAVDDQVVPDFTLGRPASIILELGTVSNMTRTTEEYTLVRWNSAAGEWEDSACVESAQSEAGAGVFGFTFCTFGEFALLVDGHAQPTNPSAGREIFLPLLQTP